jgi:hypothetical protein
MSMRLFTTESGVPVTQNIDVLETKSSKVGNHLTLGTPLRIEVFQYHNAQDLEFEDLDELLVRFVGPYTAKFRELQSHRKFSSGAPVRSPPPVAAQDSVAICRELRV